MKKIYVDNLVFEITRKCNMTCDHCLRGDLEMIDMDITFISKVLKNISGIGQITFSGGEPSLNVDFIIKTFKYIKSHGINLCSFYIVTNGKIYSQKLVNICNEMYEYCIVNNLGKFDKLLFYDDLINIEKCDCGSLCISRDQYHEEIPTENYIKYSILPYYSNEKEYVDGRKKLVSMGKAYENGFTDRNEDNVNTILSCEYKEDESLDINDIVYISVNGDILLDCDVSYYLQDDYAIGNLNQNSFYDIIKKNI